MTFIPLNILKSSFIYYTNFHIQVGNLPDSQEALRLAKWFIEANIRNI